MALVGCMFRDLVEERKWIGESDYKEGLALAQLAPGPLAAQTAIYMGYVHYRILGATLVGLAFVLPSFLMVVVLGWAYARYGGLPWMQAIFYGVGASVIGIIAFSAQKLTKKTLGKDKLLWAIYLTAAAVTVAACIALLVWFWPRLIAEGMAVPVTLYIAVLGAMVCTALMARLPTPWTALGAVCFAVSDGMIGISKFVLGNEALAVPIWWAYATSLLLITAGLFFGRTAEPSARSATTA